MKNIFKIYRRDIKKIFTNSMAIVLAVGISVLPSLYAWFNIYANWDPYGKTGNMKVAVVIDDEGYEYKGIEINVGAEIKESLEANDSIDWQFVSKEEAVSGIQAGNYYAGIEISKSFSKSLTSIMTTEFKQPEITYYANEKKNAIATKITDKVVQTVQTEVNESFVTTVVNLINEVLGTVAEESKKEGTSIYENLQSQIKSAQSSVKAVEKTVDGFENVMEIADELGKTLNDDELTDLLDDSETLVNDTEDAIKVAEASVDAVTASVESALKSVSSDLSSSAQTIKKLNGDISSKSTTKINEALTVCNTISSRIDTVVSALSKVNSNLPKSLSAIDKLVSRLNKANKTVKAVISDLTAVLNGDTSKNIDSIADKMTSASKSLSTGLSDYSSSVKPSLDKTINSVLDVLFDVSNLLTTIDGKMPEVNTLVKTINKSLEAGESMLSSLRTLISNCSEQLTALSDKLEGLSNSELVNALLNLSDSGTDELGEFIACPVQINTEKIYGIENYGSAMAPFYSTLALWVGAVILVALIKPQVKNKKELGIIKPSEEYFGRSLIFITFALVQGLIIVLGDLYFLKIQCYHPVKFIFAGLFASFVFSFFIYSLVAAFGDIGKAIVVVFLVIQIGGCGGTFPIDVTPEFFQVINPFLPYTFVIDAMRECVCGTYSNNYWICLLKLSAYLAAGLVIGTLFRYLFRKPMRFFSKKVEKTGLF